MVLYIVRLACLLQKETFQPKSHIYRLKSVKIKKKNRKINMIQIENVKNLKLRAFRFKPDL